jgi:hypothetical protein
MPKAPLRNVYERYRLPQLLARDVECCHLNRWVRERSVCARCRGSIELAPYFIRR